MKPLGTQLSFTPNQIWQKHIQAHDSVYWNYIACLEMWGLVARPVLKRLAQVGVLYLLFIIIHFSIIGYTCIDMPVYLIHVFSSGTKKAHFVLLCLCVYSCACVDGIKQDSKKVEQHFSQITS